MPVQHLTILHSNDMHGAFLPEDIDGCLTGGVPMLSGYINTEREKDENTLYFFAGDMFQGSLLDRDYQGASTCAIMELIQPDAMTLGNHEVDHSLRNLQDLHALHSLPIVTTNLREKTSGEPIFVDHLTIHRGDINILVLGVTTEDIMLRKEKEPYFGAIVDYVEPVQAIAEAWQKYTKEAEENDEVYDLVILLSHLGMEEDRKLAENPEIQGKISLIVGGHTHLDMNGCEIINGIAIAQLDKGTRNIGRFDLEVDTEKHALAAFPKWSKIPVDEEHCEVNEALQVLVWEFKDAVDRKYNETLSKIGKRLETDGFRYRETKIGNLLADALQQKCNIKIATIGSGSLRQNAIGPKISLYNLREMYSFDEAYYSVVLTGAQLRQAFLKILREAPDSGDGHSEYYQISDKCHFVYSRELDDFTIFDYDGQPVQDDAQYEVGIEKFVLDHFEKFWGLSLQEVLANRPKLKLTKDVFTSLTDYFRAHPKVATPQIQKRTKRKP